MWDLVCPITSITWTSLLNNDSNSFGPAYFKQIGFYAMSKKTLFEFASLKEGALEKAEKRLKREKKEREKEQLSK